MEGVLIFLIPIVALLIPVFALYFNFKKEALKRQERMKAIEKGVELPPENLIPVVKKSWLDYLRTSIIFLSFGIGFILTYFVFNLNFANMKNLVITTLAIGVVNLLLGLGFLAYSLIFKRYGKG